MNEASFRLAGWLVSIFLELEITSILLFYECFLSLAKLVPVGYGIKKLQISVVIEDEKVMK